nr:MAG TPA: hypothetical protein [Caudoviricetes sp.]
MMNNVMYNYNGDGSIAVSTLYSDDLLKELVTQCSRGMFYVPMSFKSKSFSSNFFRVTVARDAESYVNSSGVYNLVALGDGVYKLVCHDAETFFAVFSDQISKDAYEYVEHTASFYPANYTCNLKAKIPSSSESSDEISFESSPALDTSGDDVDEAVEGFNMEYALGLSDKAKFIEYTNKYGFNFDKEVNLKKLKNILRTKI